MKKIARPMWSNPPLHGARIAEGRHLHVTLQVRLRPGSIRALTRTPACLPGLCTLQSHWDPVQLRPHDVLLG